MTIVWGQAGISRCRTTAFASKPAPTDLHPPWTRGLTPTHCRSALARECGGSNNTTVADPPRSPASRLLRICIHPRNGIRRRPTVGARLPANASAQTTLPLQTHPVRQQAGSDLHAPQTWNQTPTHCRSALARECGGSNNTAVADPSRSPASRLRFACTPNMESDADPL